MKMRVTICTITNCVAVWANAVSRVPKLKKSTAPRKTRRRPMRSANGTIRKAGTAPSLMRARKPPRSCSVIPRSAAMNFSADVSMELSYCSKNSANETAPSSEISRGIDIGDAAEKRRDPPWVAQRRPELGHAATTVSARAADVSSRLAYRRESAAASVDRMSATRPGAIAYAVSFLTLPRDAAVGCQCRMHGICGAGHARRVERSLPVQRATRTAGSALTRTQRGAIHMSRQVIDGLIIAAVLALGATHLYAQGCRRPEGDPRQPGGRRHRQRGARRAGPNGGAAMGARGFATDGSGQRGRRQRAGVQGPRRRQRRARRSVFALGRRQRQYQSGGAVSGARAPHPAPAR